MQTDPSFFCSEAVNVISRGGYPASTLQHRWHCAQWSNSTHKPQIGESAWTEHHFFKTLVCHQVRKKFWELLTFLSYPVKKWFIFRIWYLAVFANQRHTAFDQVMMCWDLLRSYGDAWTARTWTKSPWVTPSGGFSITLSFASSPDNNSSRLPWSRAITTGFSTTRFSVFTVATSNPFFV